MGLENALMAVMRLDVVSYNSYISILVVPVVLKNVSMYGRNSRTELMTMSNSDIGQFLLSYVCVIGQSTIAVGLILWILVRFHH